MGSRLIALVRAWPYFFFSPDDYYIYLRFAQNLVEHGELSFNTGVPTYGFTSALWLFVLGAAGKMTGNAMLAGKILSLVATATSPVLLYFVMRRLDRGGGSVVPGRARVGRQRLAGALVGSGMEAGLSATLALAVVLFAMRARERESAPWGAGVVAGLAPLVRPEMIGLTILFAFFWAADGPGHRIRATAKLDRGAAAARADPRRGVLGALYLHFGRVFPNTAQAKGAMVDGWPSWFPRSNVRSRSSRRPRRSRWRSSGSP